jgi:hypothetical protein
VGICRHDQASLFVNLNEHPRTIDEAQT